MARRIRVVRSGGSRRVIRHRTRSVKPAKRRRSSWWTGWLYGRNRIWKHSGQKGWWLN